MATEQLKIEGMTCQNCVRHVKTALEGVDGVDTADVSLEAGLAVVEAGAGAERTAMRAAVEAAGYRVAEG